MSTHTEEIIVYLCPTHINLNIEEVYPDHRFNWYPTFRSNSCKVDGCKESAYNMMIGVKIPTHTSNLNIVRFISTKETIDEAKELLSGGTARDRLLDYLYFKTRTFMYGSGDFLALRILRIYVDLLLRELAIDPDKPIDNLDMYTIMKKLGVLPEGER